MNKAKIFNQKKKNKIIIENDLASNASILDNAKLDKKSNVKSNAASAVSVKAKKKM